MTNCPNCGAPITGAKCEYCGTIFNAREDTLALHESADRLLASGIITFNEARELMGLPRV